MRPRIKFANPRIIIDIHAFMKIYAFAEKKRKLPKSMRGPALSPFFHLSRCRKTAVKLFTFFGNWGIMSITEKFR